MRRRGLSKVFARGFVAATAVALVACSGGAGGDGEAQTQEALPYHPPNLVKFHPIGIVVKRPDMSCPRLVVDGTVVAGVPSVQWVAQIKAEWPVGSGVPESIPDMLNEAYPAALQPRPLYCVYDGTGSSAVIYDLPAVAGAQCGAACTITTLMFPNTVYVPGGHGCPSCR